MTDRDTIRVEQHVQATPSEVFRADPQPWIRPNRDVRFASWEPQRAKHQSDGKAD